MKVLALTLALCFAGSAEAATKTFHPSAVKHSKSKKARANVRRGPKSGKIKRANANRVSRAKVK